MEIKPMSIISFCVTQGAAGAIGSVGLCSSLLGGVPANAMGTFLLASTGAASAVVINSTVIVVARLAYRTIGSPFKEQVTKRDFSASKFLGAMAAGASFCLALVLTSGYFAANGRSALSLIERGFYCASFSAACSATAASVVAVATHALPMIGSCLFSLSESAFEREFGEDPFVVRRS